MAKTAKRACNRISFVAGAALLVIIRLTGTALAAPGTWIVTGTFDAASSDDPSFFLDPDELPNQISIKIDFDDALTPSCTGTTNDDVCEFPLVGLTVDLAGTIIKFLKPTVVLQPEIGANGRALQIQFGECETCMPNLVPINGTFFEFDFEIELYDDPSTIPPNKFPTTVILNSFADRFIGFSFYDGANIEKNFEYDNAVFQGTNSGRLIQQVANFAGDVLPEGAAGIFTTDPSENKITVTLNLPAGVSPTSARVWVNETTQAPKTIKAPKITRVNRPKAAQVSQPEQPQQATFKSGSDFEILIKKPFYAVYFECFRHFEARGAAGSKIPLLAILSTV